MEQASRHRLTIFVNLNAVSTPPPIPEGVGAWTRHRITSVRGIRVTTEVRTLRQQLEREERRLDHHRAELDGARARVSELTRRVASVENTVTTIRHRLEELEELTTLREENERLRRDVASLRNQRDAPF